MIVRRSFSLVSVPAASILLGLVTFGQTAAQDVRHLCSEKYQAEPRLNSRFFHLRQQHDLAQIAPLTGALPLRQDPST